MTKDKIYSDSNKIDGLNSLRFVTEGSIGVKHNLTKDSEFLTKARELGIYISFENTSSYTDGYNVFWSESD